MKLIKFVPFIAAATLVACSNHPKPEEVLAHANQVGVSKPVAYVCKDDKQLQVTYSFVDGQAKTAKVLVDNKVIPDTLIRDPKNKDFASFSALAGGYLFNADAELNLENYAKLNPGILFQHTAEGDVILAKDCSVNEKVTQLLNK